MKSIIVFGTGENSRRFVETINRSHIKILEFWDNNAFDSYEQSVNAPWFLKGYMIRKPYSEIPENVDKIVIASSYYDDIYIQLTKKLRIPAELISNMYWYEKEKLCAELIKSQDDEKKNIYNYLRNHQLNMYPYSWYEKYHDMEFQLYYDRKVDMHYILRGSHRIYINKKLKNEHLMKSFYETVVAEQDPESPHCYSNFFPKNFIFDLLIDCGCAEGGFALEHVDDARKLMLIDGDEGWSVANKATFAQYLHKVIIENAFLGSGDKGYKSLSNLVKKGGIGKINSLIVKIDIEGFEENVLEDLRQLIKNIPNVVIIACSYHHYSAECNIKKIFMEQGLKIYTSGGYMFFSVQIERQLAVANRDNLQIGEAELRKGLTVGVRGFQLNL